VEEISSRQNATVKRFRALARSRDGDQVLLEGAHLLEEALRSGIAIEVAAFTQSAVNGRLAGLAAESQRGGARIAVASDTIFASMSPVQHPSGALTIARVRAAALDAAFAHAAPLVLVLDGVQDPGNVGAIIRAAEACGATAVVAGGGCADPFGWKALRGSMGSALRLPVVAGAAVADAIDAAHAAGLRVYAAVPRGGTRLPHCDLKRGAAILLGGEGAGLPDDLLRRADEHLTVPMRPPVESLNVAVTAALVLYEALRQRSDVAV
jgi:RNA methyltransferase, TrmH family